MSAREDEHARKGVIMSTSEAAPSIIVPAESQRALADALRRSDRQGLTVSDIALTANGWAYATEAIKQYNKLEVSPDKWKHANAVIVPPQLRASAYLLFDADVIMGSNGLTTNVFYKLATVIILPELADEPDVWYPCVLADVQAVLRGEATDLPFVTRCGE